MVSFFGVVFGVMSILGLVLVFVIVGGSFMFLVVVIGLGVVVVIINIVINVLENRNDLVVRDKVSWLGFLMILYEVFGEINWFEIGVVGFCVDKCVKVIKGIRDFCVY